MNEIIWKKVSVKGVSFAGISPTLFFVSFACISFACMLWCESALACAPPIGRARCGSVYRDTVIVAVATTATARNIYSAHPTPHCYPLRSWGNATLATTWAWSSILVVKRNVLETLSVCVKSLLKIEFLLKYSPTWVHMWKRYLFEFVSFFQLFLPRVWDIRKKHISRGSLLTPVLLSNKPSPLLHSFTIAYHECLTAVNICMHASTFTCP